MTFDPADHLTPYILTFGPNIEHLDLDLGFDVEVLAVEDRENHEFCTILNRSNQHAFGGPNDMGMPLWVMLDCAILPSAMVGFMLPAELCPDDILDLLEVDEDYEGWVPISEYCAAVSIEPGCVSGFSLHSHLAGQGIATRTKALALAAYGASAQIGVTQFDNPAIRVHARFGPMQILVHRPTVHTHSEDSFVYRLELPDRETLIQMAAGGLDFGVPDRPEGLKWLFDPTDELHHGRLASHLDSDGKAWIVSPGWRGTSDGCEIDMILGE